jgi:hypothetical protein
MTLVLEFKDGEAITRETTPEEQTEIDSRRPSLDEINAPIISLLEKNDMKSIRALRDGDVEYIELLKAEAATLRSKLVR